MESLQLLRVSNRFVSSPRPVGWRIIEALSLQLVYVELAHLVRVVWYRGIEDGSTARDADESEVVGLAFSLCW